MAPRFCCCFSFSCCLGAAFTAVTIFVIVAVAALVTDFAKNLAEKNH